MEIKIVNEKVIKDERSYSWEKEYQIEINGKKLKFVKWHYKGYDDQDQDSGFNKLEGFDKLDGDELDEVEDYIDELGWD